jgi:hypothetical protein
MQNYKLVRELKKKNRAYWKPIKEAKVRIGLECYRRRSRSRRIRRRTTTKYEEEQKKKKL